MNGLRALAMLLVLAPAARADLYPLAAGYEWTYLAFEDQGSRGLGFSHKLTRKVMAARPTSGGTFYWIRELEADPDVGPDAQARYATDLLKLAFKPPKVAADEVYFKDADKVYLELRADTPFAGPEDFAKQCSLFEADKAPAKLRGNPFLPLSPAQGDKWEGPGSQSRVLAAGPWTSEAMRRTWPETVTVQAEAGGRTQKTVFADGYGPIGWYLQTPKAKTYFELAERKFGGAQAASPDVEELRLRGILGPDQDEARPEDLALLAEMRRAEEAGGVEFLKNETGSVRPYTVERKGKDGHLQVLFNTRGYETFQTRFSQSAIHRFEELGIEAKYIFYLVDEHDRPLFDEEGLLTQQGEDVYYAMRRGAKSIYKLPGQEVAKTLPGDPRAMALFAKGYEELTAAEIRYVMKASKCSESDLQSRFTLKELPGPGGKTRYFVHKDDSLMEYVGVFRSSGDLKEQGVEGGTLFQQGDAGLCP